MWSISKQYQEPTQSRLPRPQNQVVSRWHAGLGDPRPEHRKALSGQDCVIKKDLLALLDARELQHPNSYNMNNVYNETIDQLEKLGIDKDYIQGWAGGYLGNPQREEQRVTDAYTAGYEDGQSGVTDKAMNWQSS